MLNVKKKKNLKVAAILALGLIAELVHNGLSARQVVIKNYGISFGIEGWFFIFLNIVFVAILTKIWIKNNFLSVGIIMMGGWINFIDRMIFGYVRDYWQFGGVYNNLADWLIQIGIIIFLWGIWTKKLK